MMASKPSTSVGQLPVVVKQEPVVKEEPQSDDDDDGSSLCFEVVPKAEPISEDDEEPPGSGGSQVSAPPAEPISFTYKDWKYKCGRCSLLFPSDLALSYHLAEHRAIDLRLYRCRRCQKCFGSQGALEKHGICQGRTFQCSKCWKQFDNRSRFTKHSILHRNEQMLQFLDRDELDSTGNYRCTECGATYQSLNGIRNHVHVHSALFKEEQLRCGWCREICRDAEDLRSHEQTHELLRCEECGKSYPTLKALLRHQTFHQQNKHMDMICPEVLRSEGLFKCLVCRKTFNRYEAAIFHVRSHVKALEGRYQCIVCNLKCSSALILRNHMKLIHHAPEPPGKTTGSEHEQMKSYPRLTVISDGKTPYCCPECGHYSKNATCLKMHIKRHESIRSGRYPCDICSKKCGTKIELTRHIEKVHYINARREICSEEEKQEEDAVNESQMEQDKDQEPPEGITSKDEEEEQPPTIKTEPTDESEPADGIEMFESVFVKEEPELCEEKSTKFIIESCVKQEPGEEEEEEDADEDEEIYYVVVINTENQHYTKCSSFSTHRYSSDPELKKRVKRELQKV